MAARSCFVGGLTCGACCLQVDSALQGWYLSCVCMWLRVLCRLVRQCLMAHHHDSAITQPSWPLPCLHTCKETRFMLLVHRPQPA
jgi:hypothetical protein